MPHITQSASARRAASRMVRRRWTIPALTLGAVLAIALSAPPANAESDNATSVPALKSTAQGQGGGLKASSGYPKGGLSAADARKGYKPSFGAKPYRYFGRHGYGKSGISRYGQGSNRK